jgi:hypothetical protein
MGVRLTQDAECVGVLLPVNEQELAQFDEREAGYDRVPLAFDQVDAVPFLDEEKHYQNDLFLQAKQGNVTDDLRLWVYVPRTEEPPAEEAPIVQSYLDTILRGCLSISERFAKEFIRTTKGWHPEEWEDGDAAASDDSVVVWVDDRHQPVYSRGDPQWFRKEAQRLDHLLHTHRPRHFRSRQKLVRQQ